MTTTTSTRYLLVYLDSDSTGDGAGKHADVTLYRADDREQAARLAEWLVERDISTAQDWGGYPGKAWVIDLQNPAPRDFADISELQAEHDEWVAEDEEAEVEEANT